MGWQPAQRLRHTRSAQRHSCSCTAVRPSDQPVCHAGKRSANAAAGLDARCGRPFPGTSDLLVALARKPRQVFTRDVLLEQVWGYRHPADTRLVNVHVQRLRAKVERDPENPQVVLTVRGVGYKAGPP